MAQFLPNIDELIDRVKNDKVEITVTIEPERTEITVQPWRPYTPICPYAEPKEGLHAEPQSDH